MVKRIINGNSWSYFLERVVNRIVEIDHGQVYNYEANYSKYLELKQLRLETQLSSQRKRKLFLKKELEWVRAGVQARTTKSKDRLQRFEELSKVKDIEVNGKIEMIHTFSRLGKKTIELHDISKSFWTKRNSLMNFLICLNNMIVLEY